MEKYGILNGYENGLDEANGEGSRAIPSRTSLGCEAAFIEKFPQYGYPRRFLFGLITERSWGYRCELTKPQIEIMLADLPHTLYKFDKKKGKENVTVDDEAIRLQEEANRKAAERRKKKSFELEEIFAGEADE